MTNSKLDSRQTKNRAAIDQIVPGVNTELDDQLLSINAELIPPFRLKRDTSLDVGTQRVISIEAINVSNPAHGRNHSVRPIRTNFTASKLPDFASGTITVDKTAQTLAMSPGFPSTLILPAPTPGSIQYLKVLIQVSALNSGTIIASVGTWNTSKASASFSTIVPDAYIVGYIVLTTNVGGVIQDPNDSDVYQFIGQDIIDQHYGSDIILDTSNFSNIVLPNSSSANTVQKAFDYIDDNVVAKSLTATDNAIVRFDMTTGQKIQNSIATVEDDGHIGTPGINLVEGAEPNLLAGNIQIFAQVEGTRHRVYSKDSLGNKIGLGIGFVPVGGIIATMPHLAGAYSCTNTTSPDLNGFVLCQGQTIADVYSPMNGTVIPNLQGAVFLMGSTVSGTTPGVTAGGNNTLQAHTHTVSNYTHTVSLSHQHTMSHTHTTAANGTGPYVGDALTGAGGAHGHSTSGLSFTGTPAGSLGGTCTGVATIGAHWHAMSHVHCWGASQPNAARPDDVMFRSLTDIIVNSSSYADHLNYGAALGYGVIATNLQYRAGTNWACWPGQPITTPYYTTGVSGGGVNVLGGPDGTGDGAITGVARPGGSYPQTPSDGILYGSVSGTIATAAYTPAGSIAVTVDGVATHQHASPAHTHTTPALSTNSISTTVTGLTGTDDNITHNHAVSGVQSSVENRPNYVSVVYVMRIR